MAERGKPIPASLMLRLQKLRQYMSIRRVAQQEDVSPNTVVKYAKTEAHHIVTGRSTQEPRS